MVVLPPVVAAELLSASLSKAERHSLSAFLADLALHATPLSPAVIRGLRNLRTDDAALAPLMDLKAAPFRVTVIRALD